MARGKLAAFSGDGGTIKAKGQTFSFSPEALVPGFAPVVGAEVEFDRAEGRRAVEVRPPGTPSRTAPPPRARPETPPRPGPSPDATHAFVNPYNFVPLDARGVHREPFDTASRLTLSGLSVRLCVDITFDTVACVSPVMSGPGRWVLRRDSRGRAWFPGSSLKGAVRVTLEALSNSCLSQFDTRTSFSWRPVVPSRPGFLRKDADGRWKLQPALDIRVKPKGSVTTGDKATVTAVDRGRPGMPLWYATDGEGRRFENAVYVISDFATGKRWHRLFAADGSEIDVDVVVVQAADAAHQARVDADAKLIANSTAEWLERKFLPVDLPGTARSRRHAFGGYRDLAAGESRPVWYRLDGARVRELGPPALFRRALTKPGGEPLTLGDVLDRMDLPPERSLRPCSTLAATKGDDENVALCPACRLMGATGVSRASSGWLGRVRFGTSRTPANVPPTEPVTLRPVGSPHPSAQTFYLWDPDDPGDSVACSYSDGRAQLRGRKLYWHRAGTSSDDVRIPGQQLAAIASLRKEADQLQSKELFSAGTLLRSTIDTESVTDSELGLLIAALEPARLARLLGRPAPLRTKIGSGKGLGMGTAQIRITSVDVIDAARRCSPAALDGEADARHDAGPELETLLDTWVTTAIGGYRISADRQDIDALLTMLDPGAVPPALITYPPGPPAAEWESMRWFTRRAAKDRRDGTPAPSRENLQPDALRTVKDIADRNYQFRT